jgi:hypothetical protein
VFQKGSKQVSKSCPAVSHAGFQTEAGFQWVSRQFSSSFRTMVQHANQFIASFQLAYQQFTEQFSPVQQKCTEQFSTVLPSSFSRGYQPVSAPVVETASCRSCKLSKPQVVKAASCQSRKLSTRLVEETASRQNCQLFKRLNSQLVSEQVH